MGDIVRIHPEVEAIENTGRRTINDIILARRKFENPYGSREEYKSRERNFLNEQNQIAAQLGYDIDQLAQAGNNLPQASGFWAHDGFLFYLLVHAQITSRVFGKTILEKGEPTLYNPNDMEFASTLRQQKYLFHPDRIGMISDLDAGNGMLKSYSLMQSSLSPEESQKSLRNALELYGSFQFSEVHYGKDNGNILLPGNPFTSVLEYLIGTCVRLDPSRFPDKVITGRAVRWYPGTSDTPKGLVVQNDLPTDGKLVLTNCTEQTHSSIIKPGDVLAYIPKPDLDWAFPGTLLRIIRNAA